MENYLNFLGLFTLEPDRQVLFYKVLKNIQISLEPMKYEFNWKNDLKNRIKMNQIFWEFSHIFIIFFIQ